MGKYSKLIHKILAGGSDANHDFSALCQLLVRLGFEERVKGDHHIFTRDGVEEILNLQPKGSKAKAYQVKQIRGFWSSTGWERLMSIKYELIIYWSGEDGAFVVEVPELPGCMADGETYEQAVVNARQVIEEWIETAIELGRPIPEPKGRLAYA